MNVPKLPSDFIGLSKVMPPLSRRGFMSSSAAAAAGYTLAAGPVRAEVIKTDTEGLETGDAKIKVADGEMPAYFARPKGASNPPVVLVAMEIFGLHEYVKDVTRRLAKLGAFAVAPDYYFRKGGDLTKIDRCYDPITSVTANEPLCLQFQQRGTNRRARTVEFAFEQTLAESLARPEIKR